MGIFDFLGGKDDKVKNVAINVNDKYVMWEVDISNVAYDAELMIEEGCRGIYLVNGHISGGMLMPGRRRINAKEDRKEGNAYRLIGVCAEKNFVVRIGIGGVPYKDWEMNIETTVGGHGDCTISIQKPYDLYTKIGKANITQDEVDDFVRAKISELLKTELALVLQNCDYFTITTQQSFIASQLVQKFKETLAQVGVYCENFSLKEIFFPEQYMQERRAKEEQKEDRKREVEEQRRREREQQAEIDAFNSMNFNMVNTNADSGKASYCPKCGAKVPSDAGFCSSCGNKL